MALTYTALRNAKPILKAAGKEPVLHIMPNGSKGWRLRYRFDGKPKMLSLGTYPEVTLKEASEKRTWPRPWLAAQAPPNTVRIQLRKTQTRRQAELVKLLASLPAVRVDWEGG